MRKVLDEDELELIAWRAGRGCHFEGGFLFASEFGKQVIQEDVPLLIAEIRKLRAVQHLLRVPVADEQGSSALTALMKFRSAVQDFMLSRLAVNCENIDEVEVRYPELAKALYEVANALQQGSEDGDIPIAPV